MHNYRLYYEKLTWHDPEKVFLSLYGNKKYTFWLDNNSTNQSPGNNYSYMGITNKTIKYSISNHTLSISNNSNPPTGGQKLHQNIFTYLQKELLSWKGVASAGEPRRAPAANKVSEDVGRGKRETGPLFDFTGGFVGYFGYEIGKDVPPGTSQFPDAYLFFIDKFLAFDHSQKSLYLVALSKEKNRAEQWFSTTKNQLSRLLHKKQIKQYNNLTIQQFNNTMPLFTFSRSRRQYLKDIRTCQKYLAAGDAYQICLTNQITVNTKTNWPQPRSTWLTLFRTLRKTNPAPASAYINFGNFALLSSSPEQFLHVDKNGWVTSKPMKGTIQRGETRKKDLRLARRLGKSKKDYAENIMIVDLVRNDLGKACVIGSIKVTKPLEVQTYATVHQLISTIKGKLRPESTIIDLLEASFPGGSMTGAPKIAACKIIKELEKTPRGIYSGTFGFLGLNGTANLAMTIRTIIATKDNLSFGSGGAILSDSKPQEEYNEMLLKAQPLMVAITKTVGAKTFRLNS